MVDHYFFQIIKALGRPRRVVSVKMHLILSLFATMFLLTSKGQDLHFSQFINNPLLTNPANTGFNPDNDYRVGLSYRGQWLSLPVPYKTISAWGDWQLLRNSAQNGWLGLGGMILRDVAGAGNLTSTKAYGSVAYHQQLGEGSLLSAGFNVGWVTKSIDITKFKWENQWNGKFFDASAPSGEQIAYSQIAYPDIQMGLNYAFFGNGQFYLNGGVSLMHLNRPRESFFQNSTAYNKIPVRYSAFVNASYKAGEQLIVNPAAYYSNQAGASELVAGLNLQYNLLRDGDLQLLAGGFFRVGDAAVALVGLQWNNIRLSFSYDATLSNLKTYNGSNGATEFSLLKFGEYVNTAPRDMRCPGF